MGPNREGIAHGRALKQRACQSREKNWPPLQQMAPCRVAPLARKLVHCQALYKFTNNLTNGLCAILDNAAQLTCGGAIVVATTIVARHESARTKPIPNDWLKMQTRAYDFLPR